MPANANRPSCLFDRESKICDSQRYYPRIYVYYIKIQLKWGKNLIAFNREKRVASACRPAIVVTVVPTLREKYGRQIQYYYYYRILKAHAKFFWQNCCLFCSTLLTHYTAVLTSAYYYTGRPNCCMYMPCFSNQVRDVLSPIYCHQFVSSSKKKTNMVSCWGTHVSRCYHCLHQSSAELFANSGHRWARSRHCSDAHCSPIKEISYCRVQAAIGVSAFVIWRKGRLWFLNGRIILFHAPFEFTADQ